MVKDMAWVGPRVPKGTQDSFFFFLTCLIFLFLSDISISSTGFKILTLSQDWEIHKMVVDNECVLYLLHK